MEESTPTYQVHRLEGLPPEGFIISNFVTEHEEEYLLRKIAESPQPKWKTQSTGRRRVALDLVPGIFSLKAVSRYRVQHLGGSLSKNNVLIPEPLPEWITRFPALIERIRNIVSSLEDRHTPSSPDKAQQGRPMSREEKLRDWTPNSLLINEYQAGQGIAPHEDGPAYLPLVATISLGSPQTLEIYQYLAESDPSPPLTGSRRSDVFGDPDSNTASASSPSVNEGNGIGTGSGRPIATTPMGCIYLEPRSLFICRKALYETFLHGITPMEEDVFQLFGVEGEHDDERKFGIKVGGVNVANSAHLEPELRERLRRAFEAGEMEVKVERGKRVSLTFRRVERVLQAGLGVGVLGRGSAGAKR